MFARHNTFTTMVLALIVLCCMDVHAQDTRTVTEPVIPGSCKVLTAQLSSDHGSFSDADEVRLDTARIQGAMDKCAKGKAVELKADGAKNAFLTGPLMLRTGVVLSIDRGVTLYASRNPRDYEYTPNSCGLMSRDEMLKFIKNACHPLITAVHVSDTGIMGDGIIDGRGNAKMLGTNSSWWEVDIQSHVDGKATHVDEEQPVPQFITAEDTKNLTLYRITLRNAPHYNIWTHHCNGVTAWALKIEAPKDAPNTDGFDPSASTNVTIAYSYIRVGDDNVAITSGDDRMTLTGGAGDGPATNISVLHNHFYYGHGMSIGSNTDGGVSHVLVQDLSIDGATSGLRLKSSPTRGGLTKDVLFDDVCIRGSKEPITARTDYAKLGGTYGKLPSYQDITLHNVRVSGGGGIPLKGFDATHRAGIRLDGVVLDDPSKYKIAMEHADVTLGPGPVNIPFAGGTDSTVQGKPGTGTLAACTDKFVPFPATE